MAIQDFPGSPVAKTVLPMQGARIQSLVREGSQMLQLKDLACCNEDPA